MRLSERLLVEREKEGERGKYMRLSERLLVEREKEGGSEWKMENDFRKIYPCGLRLHPHS